MSDINKLIDDLLDLYINIIYTLFILKTQFYISFFPHQLRSESEIRDSSCGMFLHIDPVL